MGTLATLLKAQKHQLEHLRHTRKMMPRHYPNRVFQPWPTGDKPSTCKRRGMKRCMGRYMGLSKRTRFVDGEKEDVTSTSLPVENSSPKIPAKAEKIATKQEKATPEVRPMISDSIIPAKAVMSQEELQMVISALLKEQRPETMLPGQRKPLQTVDLTLEMDDSCQESTFNDSRLDQSVMDQSMMDHSELNGSILDELPSEASFSKHLEERPDTACSTPAKPEALPFSMENSFNENTPKRRLTDLEGEGKLHI